MDSFQFDITKKSIVLKTFNPILDQFHGTIKKLIYIFSKTCFFQNLEHSPTLLHNSRQLQISQLFSQLFSQPIRKWEELSTILLTPGVAVVDTTGRPSSQQQLNLIVRLLVWGMWWLNGGAPDCKTCSPGFEFVISPSCKDMSVPMPAGLA